MPHSVPSDFVAIPAPAIVTPPLGIAFGFVKKYPAA
jgi:hypothetical protein